jgi:hypothetical protein
MRLLKRQNTTEITINIQNSSNSYASNVPTLETENNNNNTNNTETSSDALKDALPSLLMHLQKSTCNQDNNSSRKRTTQQQLLVPDSSSPIQYNGLTPSGKPRSRTLKTCPVCQKEIYNLPDHMKTHSNERPYACNLCPISFKRKGDLNRHIRNTHRSEPDETKQSPDAKHELRDSITELASLLHQ